METPLEHADVVVVGGGLAGLSAACFLARAGRRVTLLEKSGEPGGRAVTRLHAGYAFNVGPHALYTGGAASRVLTELGVGYGPPRSPRGVEVLRGGRFYPLPVTPRGLLASRLLSPADKLELVRFFGGLPRQNPAALASVSAQAWIEGRTRRPNVRRLLEATARTAVYSAALHLVSAEVLVGKLQTSLRHPIHYPDGGWQTLVDGLRRRAESLGARIVSGERAEAVLVEGGRVRGVRLGRGRVLSAGAVLLAVGPAAAAALAPAAVGPLVRPLVPARLACLDVALGALPRPRPLVVQDLDAPRFLSTQSAFARVAPEGGAFITTFKPLDPTLSGDPAADERDLEDLLDTVQPGWRDVLVRRVFLPRIEAVGALPLAATHGLAGRPSERVPGTAGLYLAGDWVGGEGFLADTSFASAQRAAGLIEQEPVPSDERAQLAAPA